MWKYAIKDIILSLQYRQIVSNFRYEVDIDFS